MGEYTVVGQLRAYAKMIFGVLLALAVGFFLQSIFLGVLTFAILFFIPFLNEEDEEKTNGIIFSIIMGLLLFYAFGVFPISWADGLGIDLGITVGPWQVTSLSFLIVGCVFKGVMLSSPKAKAGSVSISRSSEATFDLVLTILLIGIFIWNIVALGPWNWNFAALIFVTIWLITFLSGTFGGIQTKQTVGVIMIILSFLIYTLGIGSNVVGEAAFGQWWPQVKDFGKQTLVPIKDAFKNMFQSFKDAINLLLCPTCAVRDIVQGIYTNPSGKGKIGSFGLEFEELAVPEGKITLGRPFSITTSLKNVGAKDATNIDFNVFVSGATGQELGINTTKPTGPIETYKKLTVEDAKQQVIVGNLFCSSIKERELVKNYIAPVKAVAEYDYRMDSSLSVEFIKSAERERLLKDKKLERKKGRSEMTTSPLALSLAIDIDQPIEENTRFYLGIEAKSQEKDGKAKDVRVKIVLPKELDARKVDLTGGSNNSAVLGTDVTIDPNLNSLTWLVGSLGEEESKKIFLDFKPFEISTPTKTFVITADAVFRFEKWRELSAKFEFGGFCCPGIEEDKACQAGSRCDYRSGETVGRCVPVAQPIESPKSSAELKGRIGYCKKQVEETQNQATGVKKCDKGEGGCDVSFGSSGSILLFPNCNSNLECRNLKDAGLDLYVCCDSTSTNQDCVNTYNEWMRTP